MSWEKVKFPLPANSRVGRAAHAALLPPDSGARVRECGRFIDFAWASDAEAFVLRVELSPDDEAVCYAVRHWPGDSSVLWWEPVPQIAKAWVDFVRKRVGRGKWNSGIAEICAGKELENAA